MPSIMQRVGTPNPRHNLENEYRKHLENVDPDLSQFNLVITRRSVEEIYAQHFQPAFEAFNAKQKRKDRRLDVKWGVTTALEYQRAMDKKARASKNSIDQKGKPPIRELVWQIGNPSQGYGSAGQTEESRKRIFDMLRECQEEARRRYPQFLWGDEVIHADEVTTDAEDQEHGSIHLHAAFVPICYQNKQGPAAQVAFERCLREMGFESFNAWKHDLDQLMEEVLQRHGLKRTVMDNHEKHQDSSQFHRQQREIARTKQLEFERANSEVRLNTINCMINQRTIGMGQSISAYVQGISEELLRDPANIYGDALFFVQHCDDDQLEEISKKGRQLKKEVLLEKEHDTEKVILDLEEIIAGIAAGRIVPRELSWKRRQELWKEYSQVSEQFWEVRADLKKDYQQQFNDAYKKRRDATRSYYDALYFLYRSRSFLAIIIAVIWLITAETRRTKVNEKIEELKSKRAELIRNTVSVSQYSRAYREQLKAGIFPCEDYIECMAEIVMELEMEHQKYIDQNWERSKDDWLQREERQHETFNKYKNGRYITLHK